ncbi:hypothetical protein ACWEQL_23910 [Kitasatospora sp. NPDC004240]
MGRATRRVAACAAAVLLAGGLQSSLAHGATSAPRIDLTVLVIDDGGPATAAIAAELKSQGTPHKIVNLNDANRPVIDAAFLSDTVNGQPRGKFQGVVMPNDNPFPAGSAEMTALATYEAAFGVRQVDAYTYARPDVGLNWAQNPGYMGSLDGVQAQVTTAGTSGPFSYLKGAVPFEDNDPNIGESYGFLATPLAAPPAGATFTPLVEAPIPGSTERGSLVGEYSHDGRKELVVTFVYNQYQQQYRLLARGIVDWLTQGIHLGYDRNYFAAHIDDVFLADDRWDMNLKCTPGDVTCPPGTPETSNPIRMNVADAQYAKQWQIANGFTMDMVFNGGGSEDWKADHEVTADPVVDQMVADKASYRWVNHTYTHPYMGCLQDVSVVPWKCTKDAGGNTVWIDQATITAQIKNNLDWATARGLPVDKTELVTGEHSGLLTAPQETSDNPYLAPSLATNGVKWLASDASREPAQRAVGAALTIPRYPMNVFYNAGTVQEQTDEYNWIYTSKANGGSGACESANSTCLTTPLNVNTGYQSYIVPLEARIDLGHVLSNDPRPHFIHQSNLAEDRIVYPVLERILSTYRSLHADNTPIVNLAQKDLGLEFQRRAAWNNALASGQVTAYRVGDTVTIAAPAGVQVQATMPTGTTQKLSIGSTAFGGAYAGTLSGWVKPAALQSNITLKLTAAGTPEAPASVSPTAAAEAITAPAPTGKTVVPQGTADAVPAGPGDTERSDAPTLVPGSGAPVAGKGVTTTSGKSTTNGKVSGGKTEPAKKTAGTTGKR